MTYTSADYVDGGRSVSGWHVKDQSPELSDADITYLQPLIRPLFNPVHQLPGFPIEEEIASAERRLCQVRTRGGTALVHTAQAGMDTTKRPNSFTHLVLFDTTPIGVLGGAQSWKAPWWLTPFGTEEVRSTSLPDPTEIGPCVSITEDFVDSWIMQGNHTLVLTAIADALAERWVSGSSSSATSGLVVVGVTDYEEGSRWLGALSRMMPPGTAWSLTWSTWENPRLDKEIVSLLDAGFDLVFIPSDSLEFVRNARIADVTIIDTRSSSSGNPTTLWGRLIRNALRDPLTWAEVCEVLSESILSSLPTHLALPPAWLLAMVEVCDEGLLTEYDASLVWEVTLQLIATDEEVLYASDFLAGLISDRIKNTESRSTAEWMSMVAALPMSAPLSSIGTALVRSYMAAASTHRSYLLDTQKRSAHTQSAVNKWLASQDGKQQLLRLVTTAIDTIGRDAGSWIGTPIASLHVLDWLIREGAEEPFDGEILALANEVSNAILEASPDLLEAILAVEFSDKTASCVCKTLEKFLATRPRYFVPAFPSSVTIRLTDKVVFADAPHLAVNDVANAFLAIPSREAGAKLLQLLVPVIGTAIPIPRLDKELSSHVTYSDLPSLLSDEMICVLPRTLTAIAIRDSDADPNIEALILRMVELTEAGRINYPGALSLMSLRRASEFFPTDIPGMGLNREQVGLAESVLQAVAELEGLNLVELNELDRFSNRILRCALVALMADTFLNGTSTILWPQSTLVDRSLNFLISEDPHVALSGISRKATSVDDPCQSDLLDELVIALGQPVAVSVNRAKSSSPDGPLQISRASIAKRFQSLSQSGVCIRRNHPLPAFLPVHANTDRLCAGRPLLLALVKDMTANLDDEVFARWEADLENTLEGKEFLESIRPRRGFIHEVWRFLREVFRR